ncbi:MAG: hypothetical protein B7X90_05705 [Novosphingobium sp. 17-62-19]|uniref:hypothetical protein n=1 Tax=Novosphingobium sp. 17-62-19 TaxID=1970406 RepID=UPI000BC75CF9|nr:hypothetical protein [Novosphingobium sp. 17-62-19]OZA20577.1 MAG: hypothetical protein B7X90_05705 [Novosphingobium sp. 17-62-19]HQS95804.1 hypothetical protein [Novosphingobium sp.]
MPVGLYYWRLIMSRWRLVGGLVIGCTLLAWLFSVAVLAQRPSFESAARLNIVPTSAELGFATRFVRGQTFDGGAVMVQTYGEYVYTRPVLEPVVERYLAWEAKRANVSLETLERNASAPSFFTPGQILSWLNYGEVVKVPLREDLMQSLIENTTIEMVEGTYLMKVAVAWDDPQAAAWLANALSEAIVSRAHTQSEASEELLTTTLGKNLVAKRAELATLLNQSRLLKQRSGVVDVDTQKQGLMQELMAEESRLTSDRVALDSAAAEVAALRRQASGRMSTSQQAVEQALATAAPKADGLRQGIAIRQGRISALRAQFGKVSGSEMTIKQIDDRIALVSKEVDDLAQRVSFNLNENQTNAPKIEVIEKATPPLVRSSPKVFYNTIAGFVAGAALAAIALLLLGPGQSLAAAVNGASVDNDDAVDLRPASFANKRRDAEHAPQDLPENISIFRQRASNAAIEATPVAGPIHRYSPTMTAGANALAQDIDLAEHGEEPAQEVATEPQPTPQVAIAGVIPSPADGAQYNLGERRAACATLGDALVQSGLTSGDICVAVSVGAHTSARLLTQCALDMAKAAGRPMPVADATRASFDPVAVLPGTLVYAGAVDQECPQGWLAAMGCSVRYFIGIPAHAAADPAWLAETCERWKQDIGGEPHFFIG